MRKHTFIIGIISSSIFIIGVVLKLTHTPPAALFLVLGMILFVLGFGISFLIDRISIEPRKSYRIAFILLAVSVAFLLTSSGLLLVRFLFISQVFAYAGLMSFFIFAVYFNQNIEGRKLRLRKDRQIVSILFTDIKGFTKIMGEDEYVGIQALEKNKSIQKRLIRKYRGKWIKEIGDGTLSVFYTVTEAVLCALEMQRETLQNQTFELRMGIHVSEIIFTDKDIFGDGVNVASRVSEQAGGGEIYFTEPVYHNIKNREDLHIISLGKHEFKNVDYTLNLYKIETVDSNDQPFS